MSSETDEVECEGCGAIFAQSELQEGWAGLLCELCADTAESERTKEEESGCFNA